MKAKKTKVVKKAKKVKRAKDDFGVIEDEMNVKQANSRSKRIGQKMLVMREQLWPNANDFNLWNRKKRKGFTTMPRNMPLILQIMDSLSNGKPVSSTYLSLWCRVFDESMVTITNPMEVAFEVGFRSQRAVNTWAGRMKILVELGFIDAKESSNGPYNYVLIWNPYHVIKKLYEAGKIEEKDYIALSQRALDIGATDLNDE